MSRTPWATYLWPGLPQVYQHGSWFGLTVAIGFAGLLNLGLAASLLWCELVTPEVRTGVWAAILAIWGGSLVFSSRANRRRLLIQERPAQPNDTLPEAIGHYLKGSWFEAERVLVGLLRDDPRDVDAELMLATLLRHTGRREEAARHLDRLERMEDSAGWQWEIRCERQRLSEVTPPHDEQAPEAAEVSQADSAVRVDEAA